VPWGYVIDVYSEDNGVGPIVETFEGALLDDGSGLMKCYQTNTQHPHSVRIRRHSSYGAVGKWVAWGATQDQTLKITIGLKSTDTKKSLTEIKDTLTIGASYSAGVNFFNLAKESVTVDVKNEFMVDFQNSLTETMEFSETITWETGCTEQNDAPGTFLW